MYKNLFNKWIKQCEGSISVEFSMVGIGFIMLIIGIIELGRLAWTTNVVDYAVDEAARYAMLHQDATYSEVEDHARDSLDSLFVPSSGLNIAIQNTDVSGVNFIEITGNYQFTSLTNTVLPDALSAVTLAINSRRPVYLIPEND